MIKVENPKGGDDTRAWGPPFAGNQHDPADRGESAYFLSVNRNKKSITVNFRTKEGQAIIHDLAKRCDILVENYVPGKLQKYGLGYEQLKELNPKLIYASITGYGQTGPYATRPGYDCIIEAEAGLMHITGESTGPPVMVGVAVTGKHSFPTLWNKDNRAFDESRTENFTLLPPHFLLVMLRPHDGFVRSWCHHGSIACACQDGTRSAYRLLANGFAACHA